MSKKTVLFLALLVCLKMWLWTLIKGPQLIWDSYWYLNLAHALRDHGGYFLADGNFHSKYPPGLPLILAAVSPLFPDLLLAGGVISIVASLAVVGLVFCFGRLVNSRTGVLSAVVISIHHLSVVHTNLVLTEQVFTSLALGSLYSLLRGRRSLAWILFAGAALVRYEGIILLLPLIWDLLKNRPNSVQKFSIGVALTPLVSWAFIIATQASVASSGTYLGELARWNIHDGIEFLLLSFWIGPLFLILGLWGLARALRYHTHIYAPLVAFSWCFFLVHFFWWFTDIRFYVPILPALALGAAVLLDSWLEKVQDPRVELLISTVVIAIMVLEQSNYWRPREYEYRRYNVLYLRHYEPVQKLAAWIRKSEITGPIAVPELSVYRTLLPNKVIKPYDSLGLAPPTVRYVVIDNLHFENPALQQGLLGRITIADSQGGQADAPVTIRHIERGAATSDDSRYAALLEISPFGLLP